jgi:hypothetical protein
MGLSSQPATSGLALAVRRIVDTFFTATNHTERADQARVLRPIDASIRIQKPQIPHESCLNLRKTGRPDLI